MQTTSRQIEDWFNDVRRGFVRLPRFQRDEVWTPEHVEKFLWAILKKRPLGVFLVLEANPDEPPFETRPLPGSPDNGESCRQYLLDGQQRLTALWRSFSDNYSNHTYYVTFEKKKGEYMESGVKAFKKTARNKSIIDNPIREFEHQLLPVKILAPENNISANSPTTWRKEAEQASNCNDEYLDSLILRLRNRFSATALPYFSLPQDTPVDEAIDIFIETNRSSVRLSAYDLAVAQMEIETSESLKDKVEELERNVLAIVDLEDSVGDLVLKVRCLIEEKRPTYGNYVKLDFNALTKDWDDIVAGIKWTSEILKDLRIWNAQRLPTAVPLRVLPALHRYIPKSGHAHAKAMRLVGKYLWWSFFTDRYDRQANDRLKEDYDALVEVLGGRGQESNVPVFTCDRPEKEHLKKAGWPKNRGTLSRAILVACSLDGARDITSNKKLRLGSKVDHHHIFPKALLKEFSKPSNVSLNCMLLDPPSNKEWAKKWPGDFLLEAIQASEFTGKPENEVKKRLKTHLVPGDYLIAVRKESGEDLGEAYENFLDRRADMVMERIEKLLKDGEK